MSLKNRLTFVYAVFTGGALLVLSFILNVSLSSLFAEFVRDSISAKSAEIARVISAQYDVFARDFNRPALEEAGMRFVHDGYIVSVEDSSGELVWDARGCDMGECVRVLEEISLRMKNDYRIEGTLRKERFPLTYANLTVGYAVIETYGPYFYSETEAAFLKSLNRLLFVSALVLTGLSCLVSALLAAAISRPILRAKEAAKSIAAGNLEARVEGNSRTRELRELSSALNGLASELQEAERRQKQLSSDVAHELRTPLTCLRGNIEAMLDGVWEPSPAMLANCQEEILRLSKLVDDLDLLTGLEWENITLEKTDFELEKLLQAAAEQFAPLARAKGIDLVLELVPGRVEADYGRLKQVFINLLSNALKYTDTGSITLTNAPSGSGWEITVSDTGCGIPRDELSRVFERFYRTDKSRARGTGGAGIGLTIAAAIVKAHGGRISAEKSPEGGSVFRVAL